MLLSPSISQRRKEQIPSPSLESARLLSSSSSSKKHEIQIALLLSESCLSETLSLNKPSSNTADISCSLSEHPSQPKLVTYSLNKDKRSFRMTIPVSSTTPERSFSEMILINTSVRTSVSYNRLGD